MLINHNLILIRWVITSLILLGTKHCGRMDEEYIFYIKHTMIITSIIKLCIEHRKDDNKFLVVKTINQYLRLIN